MNTQLSQDRGSQNAAHNSTPGLRQRPMSTQQSLGMPKQRTNEVKLGGLSLPARSVVETLKDREVRVADGAKKLQERIAALRPTEERTLKESTLTKERTEYERKLNKLQQEANEAFAAERPALTREISALQTRLSPLVKKETVFIDSVKRPRILRELALRKAQERLDAERTFLSKVVKLYPEVRHLDLSCLHALRTPQGLPKVALFHPDYSDVQFFVCDERTSSSYGFRNNLVLPIQGCTGCRISYLHGHAREISDLIDRENLSKLAFHVCKATGVVPTNRDYLESVRLAKIIGTRKPFGFMRKPELQFRVRAHAEAILITAEFSDGGRIIPSEARKAIHKAKNSGLFDQVVLLAEVPSWKVSYAKLGGKARIEGTEIIPVNPDPLIVGLKKLESGKLLSLVVDAFDLTLVEKLIEDEFATKV